MAARPEAPAPEIVELSRIGAGDLDPLIEEEIRVWRTRLHWDFRPAADLIRRYVGMRALSGFALLAGSRPAGYTYYVCEDRKGLVGNLYVGAAHGSRAYEHHLLAATVEAMMASRAVARIESQLMLLGHIPASAVPFAPSARCYERNFMVLDFAGWAPLPPGKASLRAPVATWDDRYHEDAARLIPAAYAAHIDADINDQYRSIAGARRFLTNLAQYPGCGTFFQPASLVAFHPGGGWVCGVSLASLVAEGVGHITQICVAPEVRGTGVGYELLRRSLGAFRSHGCRKVSLTVTASNRRAVELYERVGFRRERVFPALVWEGF